MIVSVIQYHYHVRHRNALSKNYLLDRLNLKTKHHGRKADNFFYGYESRPVQSRRNACHHRQFLATPSAFRSYISFDFTCSDFFSRFDGHGVTA